MQRVFPSYYHYFVSSQKFQFHRVCTGDSEAVVTPFMQVGTYPTRNFATLRPLQLQPPFTASCIVSRYQLILILQHRAGVRPYTSYFYLAKSCVFSKQSPLSILLHPIQIAQNRYPFSKVTGLICRVPSIQLTRRLSILYQLT